MQPPFARYRRHLAMLGVSAAIIGTACAPYLATQPVAGPRIAVPGQAPALAQAQAQSAQATTATEITVTATEFKFNPSNFQVTAGQKVKITLDNKGVIEHDLSVDVAGLHLIAPAGKTASTEIVFDKPGTYDIICTIPGHKEAGMKATLVVADASGAKTAVAAAPTTSQPAGQTAAQVQLKPLPVGLSKLPQPTMAPPVNRTQPATVKLDVETKEITALMADGVAYTYWTFNGTVPGPMMRVRQGDTVEMTLRNPADSKATHSIDLHAVTGPGGGAAVTQVPPGGQASFKFKALNPGVYVYHCATPMVAHHIASGMYGMIVVEPPEGYAKVDREYYVMQGDFYLQGDRAQQGLHDVDLTKMIDERPDYVLFNGGSLDATNVLKANVGETVRIFFGVGGPNLTSSFHVIGEIFDRVHQQGASEVDTNVQTTLVPAGGATMVEFKVDVPGRYVLVDHSLGRMEKGGAAFLQVDGPENPAVFEPLTTGAGGSGGH